MTKQRQLNSARQRSCKRLKFHISCDQRLLLRGNIKQATFFLFFFGGEGVWVAKLAANV